MNCLARLKLKWITAFRDRHGHLRHYFRRPGFKRATLPGLPGSAEFMAAYQAALEGHPLPPTQRSSIGEARTIRGSVSAAVALYLGSTNFSQLADATKYERSRILNRFR